MKHRLQANKNLTLHHQDHYYDFPLILNHGPLIEEYLFGTQLTLQNALREYPRTCAFRIDLRLPKQTKPIGTQVISKFFASFKSQVKENLKRRLKMNGRVHKCNVRYIWVKEQNKSLNWHYHILVIVNKDCYDRLGDYKAVTGNISARIKKAWASALGYELKEIDGLVHFPVNATYHIDKNSASYISDFDTLFKRVSYFAKAETKNFGDSSKAFGTSRNKPIW